MNNNQGMYEKRVYIEELKRSGIAMMWVAMMIVAGCSADDGILPADDERGTRGDAVGQTGDADEQRLQMVKYQLRSRDINDERVLAAKRTAAT